jgi:2-keto-4-pentenoate hydratase/2-oxohepta-3-ene-1,7-dioic acid hydratase in catechol pathway
MRLVTFVRPGGVPEPGRVDGNSVTPLGSTGFQALLDVISGGKAALDKARAASGGAVALDSVKLMAPVPRPPKIICVGLNYRDHAIESNMQIPTVPTIFCKFPTAVIGPGDNIVLPKISTQPDYEAEFAFVIGKGGRNIPAANWADHVFGYMNLNDVSARDVQLATTQWVMGKTFDTFCPMGPWIVTADEIADPHNLDISLEIGGEVLQNSNTRHLIFRIPDLIAHLSSVFTLEPGDVVSTGTPAGVGFARKPPRYLKAGDECVVKVQGLGELRNPVVAE